MVYGVGTAGGAGLAQIRIRTTPAQLLIDSTKAREEIGLLGTTELAFDGAAFARQRAAQGVAATVSDGDRMAQPYTGENVIASLAFEHALREQQFQLAFIPRTPPQITYIPGDRQIDLVF